MKLFCTIQDSSAFLKWWIRFRIWNKSADKSDLSIKYQNKFQIFLNQINFAQSYSNTISLKILNLLKTSKLRFNTLHDVLIRHKSKCNLLMVSLAALCPGDPGSNPSWFAVKKWVYTNNTSLWSSNANCNHSDCE